MDKFIHTRTADNPYMYHCVYTGQVAHIVGNDLVRGKGINVCPHCATAGYIGMVMGQAGTGAAVNQYGTGKKRP